LKEKLNIQNVEYQQMKDNYQNDISELEKNINDLKYKNSEMEKIDEVNVSKTLIKNKEI
jgi:hypothetical protein